MKVSELKARAKELGVKGYSRMRKAEWRAAQAEAGRLLPRPAVPRPLRQRGGEARRAAKRRQARAQWPPRRQGGGRRVTFGLP